METYIDENEKIIEKYHRKVDEIFQLLKDQGENIQLSPIAVDYKKQEDEEKRLCNEKKNKFLENQINNQQMNSNDQGVYL